MSDTERWEMALLALLRITDGIDMSTEEQWDEAHSRGWVGRNGHERVRTDKGRAVLASYGLVERGA